MTDCGGGGCGPKGGCKCIPKKDLVYLAEEIREPSQILRINVGASTSKLTIFESVHTWLNNPDKLEKWPVTVSVYQNGILEECDKYKFFNGKREGYEPLCTLRKRIENLQK